jgi:hypothetical protein
VTEFAESPLCRRRKQIGDARCQNPRILNRLSTLIHANELPGLVLAADRTTWPRVCGTENDLKPFLVRSRHLEALSVERGRWAFEHWAFEHWAFEHWALNVER